MDNKDGKEKEIRKGKIRADTGNKMSCRGWQQEAALRMLMNNLDPDVAEAPEKLVVYASIAKAARTWKDYDRIVEILHSLENDETLVIQSGKPVGVFKTFEDSPRIIMACGFIVPEFATHENFRELQAKELTMRGGFTAGSWIYIGAQGIIQGTYETLLEVARHSLNIDSLRGRLILTSGLGGMGRAQPLAITMNEGVGIIVEVDKAKIERSLNSTIKFLDTWTDNFDEAIKTADEALKKKTPLSIGLLGNAADIFPEFARRRIIPDIVTDQSSAHDELNGYVPAGISFKEALKLRGSDPDRYIKMSYESIVKHVQAMNELQDKGSIVFEYGNWIRGQARKGGLKNSHQFPGFIDGYIRHLFCQGRGPFRWVALSGNPEDIYQTDKVVVKIAPRLERWIQMARERIPFQGLPARIAWLGHGERTQAGLEFNELVRKGKINAPIVIGRDHLDCGSVASPDKQSGNMKDGSEAIGDWPIVKGMLNVASGASWVAIHSTPELYSSGMIIVADGTEKAKERIKKALTADTAMGVTRLADAGYELAVQTLKERGGNSLLS